MKRCSFVMSVGVRTVPASTGSNRSPFRSRGHTALQPSKTRLSPSCFRPTRPASARSVAFAVTAGAIWHAVNRRQIMS